MFGLWWVLHTNSTINWTHDGYFHHMLSYIEIKQHKNKIGEISIVYHDMRDENFFFERLYDTLYI